MKLNLKTTINNLAGKPLKNNEGQDVTLGEAVANILGSSETGGKMKMFILAKKFFEQESIELDEADLALVKKEVSTSRTYQGSLVSGQVELLLSEAK